MAAAVAGSNLARRLAASEREWSKVDVVDRLATEFAEDRAALQEVMGALDVPVRLSKTCAAWTANAWADSSSTVDWSVGRPLSRVLALEAMLLGVERKAAGWRTLQAGAMVENRLDADRLDVLIERARAQIVLELLPIEAAAEVFPQSGGLGAPGRVLEPSWH